MPREALEPLLAAPGRATSVTVRGDRGAGAVAAAGIRGLAQQRSRLDARQTLGLINHVLGLIALGVTAALPPARTPPGEAVFQAALDEVDRALADPGLTPGEVARRVHVSERYLVKLFAAHGTTVGRWLLGRRLDRAWAALDPTLDAAEPRRVTDVALECGFRDPSHFARTFRARFGISPARRLHGGG